MNVCCSWCNKVYKPKTAVKNPNRVYCCQGCLDADIIFRQLCELQFNIYIKKRIPRIGE